MKEETQIKICVFIIILLAVILVIFAYDMHQKKDCWLWNIETKTETYSLIDNYRYSCDDLERMILLSIYPEEVLKKEIRVCNGIRINDVDSDYVFNLLDIKEEYKSKCFLKGEN